MIIGNWDGCGVEYVSEYSELGIMLCVVDSVKTYCELGMVFVLIQ